MQEALGEMIAAEVPADKNWYKLGAPDIPVLGTNGRQVPLSVSSRVVANLKSNRQTFVYARPENVSEAKQRLAKITEGSK